jgi:alcohol dehydrogenase class IV
MIEFSFNIPTRILFSRGAVRNNAEALRLGKRAFVVTGKSSGRLSGALNDVERELDALKITYEIFEGVGNNPDVEQCRELGARARNFHADFVIGIGGGSPIDAAKAVAVFGAEDIEPEILFQNKYDSVLPIIAIPTTSGTGSEATPWSVLTWKKVQTKQSFGGIKTFPRVAFLDPGYTESLSPSVTLDTAFDAFSHCLESVISTKASPVTDALNFYALSRFGGLMESLERGEHTSIREDLMLISLLGGIVIANTGTTLMHAMGYPLTYFKNVPHGRANAYVLPAYLTEVGDRRPQRLEAALKALGISQEELITYIKRKFPFDVQANAEELSLWAAQTAAKDPQKTTGVPNDTGHIRELYEMLF